MALITCKDCKKEVSTDAKTCPNCGAKVVRPKKTMSSTLKYLLAILAAAIILPPILGFNPGTTGKVDPVLLCQTIWEKKHKSSLKDPSSLDWDTHHASRSTLMGGPVLIIPYRAKNSYGAITLEKATCLLDSKTQEVSAVL